MLFFIPTEASLFFEGYKYKAGVWIKAEGKVLVLLMMEMQRTEGLSVTAIIELKAL